MNPNDQTWPARLWRAWRVLGGWRGGIDPTPPHPYFIPVAEVPQGGSCMVETVHGWVIITFGNDKESS